MQQDAWPAGAEHDLHLARRGSDAVEVEQSLAQRLVGAAPPDRRVHHMAVAETAAGSMASGLAPAILLDDHGDVEAHERPEVGHAAAVGAHDLHRLPLAVHGRHHLRHARVLRAGIGVDLGQQRGAHGEVGGTQRVLIAVEALVGCLWGRREGALVAGADGAHAVGGAGQRVMGDLAGMGVAGGLARHRPQPETERGVGTRRADAAVLQGQRLALPVFEEQFAVIGPGQRLGDEMLGGGTVERRASITKEQPVGGLERRGGGEHGDDLMNAHGAGPHAGYAAR